MKKYNVLIFILTSILVLTNFTVTIKASILNSNRANKGNGKVIQNEIQIEDTVSKLYLGNMSAKIYLTNEDDKTIKYKIDENLEQYLDISAENGTLRIDNTSENSLKNKYKEIEFYIGIKTLEQVTVQGGFEIEGNGTFETDNLTFDIEGALNGNLDVKCKAIYCEIKGAIDMTLTGTTDNLDINTEGASDINSKNLKANNVNVEVYGVGNLKVYAKNKLNIESYGVLNLVYYGNPTVSKNDNFLSRIKKGN